MANESNGMSFKESEYWDSEISDDELDELAANGAKFMYSNSAPIPMIYRIDKIRWNIRIKKQYRPIV